MIDDGYLFTFRQVKAAGKDPDEEELDKIELECVRKTVFCTMCTFRKYPYSPTGHGGFCKKCVKLYWNFQRGGRGLRKSPFRGGGMDIFWNYTIDMDIFS